MSDDETITISRRFLNDYAMYIVEEYFPETFRALERPSPATSPKMEVVAVETPEFELTPCAIAHAEKGKTVTGHKPNGNARRKEDSVLAGQLSFMDLLISAA